MPRALFDELRFTLRAGDEPGWEALQQRLFRLGYARADVVSAAGEYAVRGGILDVFPATRRSAGAHRVLRRHDRERCGRSNSRRSAARRRSTRSRSCRGRDSARRACASACSSASTGRRRVAAALAAYIAGGNDVPEAWLPLAYDDRATLLDYLDATRSSCSRSRRCSRRSTTALEEERSREAARAAGRRRVGRTRRRRIERRRSAARRDRRAASALDEIGDAHRAARYAASLPGAIESPATSAGCRALVETLRARDAPGRTFQPADRDCSREACASGSAAAKRVLIVSSARRAHAATLLRARRNVESDARMARHVDHGSHRGGLLDSRPALARARRSRDLRAAAQARQAARGQGRRAGHAGRSARRRLRRARRARHRAVSRLAHRDDPRRDAGLHRPEVRRAPTACSCRCTRCIRSRSTRRRRRSAAALQDGRRRLGAHEGARLRSAREDRRRSGRSCTPSASLRAATRSVPIRRGKPNSKKRSRTSRRPISTRPSTRSRPTWKRARPMDRLVCGDVGYGKTEVAMRAAFKAIADKKQVAVLVPTTLLAAQHYRTFSARFAGFPGAHRRALALQDRRQNSRRSCAISPRARSTSSSARTGCCRRTSSSPTSA